MSAGFGHSTGVRFRMQFEDPTEARGVGHREDGVHERHVVTFE